MGYVTSMSLTFGSIKLSNIARNKYVKLKSTSTVISALVSFLKFFLSSYSWLPDIRFSIRCYFFNKHKSIVIDVVSTVKLNSYSVGT